MTLQIRITVAPLPPGFGFTARDFLDALHGRLNKTTGGSCIGVVDGGTITLETHAASREEVESLVGSYCGSLKKDGRAVEIVVVENPAKPLSDTEAVKGAMLNSAPVKLTKAFFMKQAEGVFLASNLCGQGFESVFAESVFSAETRAEQWQRIRAAGADQRACHVFPTEGHYRQWLQQQIECFKSLRN